MINIEERQDTTKKKERTLKTEKKEKREKQYFRISLK